MARSTTAAEGLTGRHVLIAVCGFFGIVFLANAYLVRMALSTYSGVVSNEPYRKGLKYNDRIVAAERQQQLGWREVFELGGDGRLAVRMLDANGQPISGLAVEATVGRPTTTSSDLVLPLAETEQGLYQAAAGLPQPGAYVAAIEVRDPAQGGADVLYRARKRLWLKP